MDKRFATRWKALAHEQLFRGDIRDLTNIQEINQLEILAELLKQQAGELVSYTSLVNKIRVSADTVRRWTYRGFGEFGLHFLRDKEQREVDFLVTKDKQPWCMVEVKTNRSVRARSSKL